jgi:leucyl aminopeptidase
MLKLKLATALCGAACALSTQAASVWITLGDRAFNELRRIAPNTVNRHSEATARGRPAQGETIHVAEVDDAQLSRLSEAMRHTQNHGPGFAIHASRQEAVAAMMQAGTTGQASSMDYPITNSLDIRRWISQMQGANIVGTIMSLSNFINRHYKSLHGAAASDWLAFQWKQLAASRTDVTVEQFVHAGWPQKSVVLTIKGRDPEAGIVVLGGHLDSMTIGDAAENARAPGADDNASGIASLTEALRVLLANHYQPRRTLKFIGYAAEEAGLLGSQEIARKFVKEGDNVVGVLQLDMTNYKGDPKDLYLITDYTSRAQNTYLMNLAKAYLPELSIGTSTCGYACSDHASWNAQGVPASFPTESDRNSSPYIHTSNDTIERADRQGNHALKFSKLALVYAAELGGGLRK